MEKDKQKKKQEDKVPADGDLIYDIGSDTPKEKPEQHADDNNGEVSPKEAENKEAENKEEDSAPQPDPAFEGIKRMVAELGAETVLNLIRDNRNAAIEQILKEVEAKFHPEMHSGPSVEGHFNSIFDLASMA